MFEWIVKNRKYFIVLTILAFVACKSSTGAGDIVSFPKGPSSSSQLELQVQRSLGDKASDNNFFNAKDLLNKSTEEIDQYLKEGDFIFQESQSSQGPALNEVTLSIWSHVGILFKSNGQETATNARGQSGKATKGEWLVLEAVQPVRYSTIANFVSRSRNYKALVRRLSPETLNQVPSQYRSPDGSLNASAIALLRSKGEKYLGKNYDVLFEMNNNAIYCSELTFKMYKEALGIDIGDVIPVDRVFSKINVDSSSGEVRKEYPAAFRIINQRFKDGFGGEQFRDWFKENQLVTPVSQVKSPVLVDVKINL